MEIDLLRLELLMLETEHEMLKKEFEKLEEENQQLKKELSKPERMTPSEEMAYWGIFG